MPGFRKVLKSNPGNAELLKIESVVIIDLDPPQLSLGVGTGTVLLIAEFEKGAPNRPMQIFSSTDQTEKIGGLGFVTSVSNYDGAVARKSGGDELWGGNGFVWMRNKKFSSLVVCRVDNSAGNVDFRRLACLTGGAGPFSSATADQVVFELNGGPTTATAVATGAKAQLDAAGASYPVSISGLTLEVIVDTDVSRLVTFTTETLVTEVRDTINAVLAQPVATDNGGQLRMESVIAGGAGYIQVVGGTARTLLGFPTAVVQQLDTWTVAATSAGTYTLRTQLLVSGVLTNFDATAVAAGGESVGDWRDIMLAAQIATAPPGVTFASSGGADVTATGDDNITFTSSVVAEPTPADIGLVLTTAAVVNAMFGTGNVQNLVNYTVAEAAAFIDAVANLSAEVDSSGNLRVCNTLTSVTGTIQAISGALVATLGLNTVDIADAAVATDVVIPAGTIVQGTSPTTKWVTMEDIQTGTAGGPFNAKVRPWEDTDSALASAASNVTTIVSPLPAGFVVTNAASITRLSANQLDVRYADALDATLDLNTPSTTADFVASARTSESIMRKLLSNSIQASQSGLAPRKCLVRPVIGTSIVDAQGITGTGVGIERNDRRQYCFPGVVTEIPEIKSVGTRGGLGFTDDGLTQVGSDGFLSSVVSILNPEENAGQKLSDTNVEILRFTALEDAYNPEKGGSGLTDSEYEAFKAAGITAPKISINNGALFQSDVTSVNPATSPTTADGSRRRMADFIIRSLQDIAEPYVKKLGTPKRVNALFTAVVTFLRTLESADQPDNQRIDSFSAIRTSTEEQIASGIFAFDVGVKTIASMKVILFNVTVGTTVVIQEAQ